MLQWCNRKLQTALVTCLIFFYVAIGFASYKKKHVVQYEDGVSNYSFRMKTLIGYSLRYQIEDELRSHDDCATDLRKPSFRPDKSKTTGHHAQLKYDRYSDIYVLNAYFDFRLLPYVYVRAIAMVPKNTTLYCQMWTESSKNFSSGYVQQSVISRIWSNDWKSENDSKLEPAVVSCVLRPNSIMRLPESLSLVKEPCSIRAQSHTIRHRERNDRPLSNNEKFRFVVCVKPLNYDRDISDTLMEWLTLIFELGATKVHIYYTNLNHRTLLAIQRISKIKFVRATHLHLPVEFSTSDLSDEKIWLKRKLEILAYNDCFYENLNSADYVVPLDIDEIIVPLTVRNWSDLIHRYFVSLGKGNWKDMYENFSSLSVRNVYFFKKYPTHALEALNHSFKHNYMLNDAKVPSIFQRKIRSAYFSPRNESGKSFISVYSTLTVFNHFSFHSLRPAVNLVFIPMELSQLNHYRDECQPHLIDNCTLFLNSVTIDDSLERLKKRIQLPQAGEINAAD